MRRTAKARAGQARAGQAKDAIAGAAGGALATVAMGKVTSYLYEHEPPPVRERYERVTGGKGPAERAAEKLEPVLQRVLGRELSEAQRQTLAQAIHWGLGMAGGAAYGVLRRRVPHTHWGHGLAYGLEFSVLVDEGLTPLLGLAEPPQAYPWQAHVRGLVGHLVYGVVTDAALHAADRVMQPTARRTRRVTKRTVAAPLTSLTSARQSRR
ncbi:MAG: DUF1440 domain-containing protein [Gemmatimonadota bacterium]